MAQVAVCSQINTKHINGNAEIKFAVFSVIVAKLDVNKRQIFVKVPAGSKFLKGHTLCSLKLTVEYALRVY